MELACSSPLTREHYTVVVQGGGGWEMTLGRAERQGRLGNVAVARCEHDLPERSVDRLWHSQPDRLFGDELFADLYVHHGRRSVPRRSWP